MERPLRGDVVVVPFPFSDLTQAKRRPAFVAAILPGDDLILCQITSRAPENESAVPIGPEDFEQGGLPLQSHVRPSRLFTGDRHLILRRAGRLRPATVDMVIEAIIHTLRS